MFHTLIAQPSSSIDFTNAFIMSVKTDNAGTSGSTQFTIPTTGVGYNYDIEYNGNFLYGQTGNVTLEFGIAGTYDVKIIGAFPRIYFNNTGDKAKLVDIKQWGNIAWASMQNAFRGCTGLTTVTATDAPDLSVVTNMGLMFYRCTSLITLDVSGWNTTGVTSLASMFYQCFNLTPLDVSGWNTGAVISMSQMFYQCSSLTTLDVSGWNTGAVISMSQMFQSCTLLTPLDVSSWNTAAVNNMTQMFYQCIALITLDVSLWNTGAVISMNSTFHLCTNLTTLDVSSWNTGLVNNTVAMFDGCTNLTNVSIKNWNITSLLYGAFMFDGANLALTTVEYDQVLVNWEAQIELTNVSIHFGDVQYTLGGAAETARTVLDTTSSWTIVDGGGVAVLVSTGSLTVSEVDNVATMSYGINNAAGREEAVIAPLIDRIYITGTLTSGSVLTANLSNYTSPNGKTLGAITYKWYNNSNVLLQDSALSTYTLLVGDVGNQIYVTATPNQTSGSVLIGDLTYSVLTETIIA